MKWEWPCRLVSLANQREHWGKRSQRALQQRSGALIRIANSKRLGRVPEGPPWVITITRVSKRFLDSDNLHGSVKSIRDGVADALGIDDGNIDAANWLVGQEIGDKYLVRVEIVSA